MADGWIKLHRALLDKSIWKSSTPEQKTILVTLLLMVWHKPNQWEWNGGQYECEPGQCITSLDSIVREGGKGISVRNVRTALERFEKLGFLTNESTKQGRLITIVNWRLYQALIDEGDKGTDSQVTNDRQTGDKRPTNDLTSNKKSLQERKNERREENVSSINTTCRTDVQRIIDAWNQTGAPEVKRLSADSKRYQMLKARIKEYGIDQVLEAIENVKSSSFLKGQSKSNWLISFEWFTRPDNFTKVLEGSYSDGKKNQHGLEEWGND